LWRTKPSAIGSVRDHLALGGGIGGDRLLDLLLGLLGFLVALHLTFGHGTLPLIGGTLLRQITIEN
jgi:hypothetical protein